MTLRGMICSSGFSGGKKEADWTLIKLENFKFAVRPRDISEALVDGKRQLHLSPDAEILNAESNGSHVAPRIVIPEEFVSRLEEKVRVKVSASTNYSGRR